MKGKGEAAGRKDEIALVTGSRRGIGLGIALALSEVGFTVVLNGVSQAGEASEAVEAVRATGGRPAYVQADISLREDRARLISEVKERFGRLDILVNNAGVAPLVREDMLVATEESFDRVMTINVKGPYFLTRDVANWMIEQKKAWPDRNMKIINISSVNAFTASVNRGEYCVSKAGISIMTALFAVRLAEYGIRVYEIRPGIIKTDMTARVSETYDQLISGGLTPISRWGLPQDIGKAAAAIAMDYFPFSTGEVFHVDGGFHLRKL